MLFRSILLLSIWIVISVSGCAKKDEGVIKVGAILPLTGDAAVFGKSLMQGMELAKEEINTSNYLPETRLIIIYEDSKADPKTAVADLEKLIAIDKAVMVIGDMFTSTTLAIAPIANRRGIVLLSPTASADAVLDSGEFVFKLYPSEKDEGRFIAHYLINQRSILEIGILASQEDAMLSAVSAFKSEFLSQGGKILFEDFYQKDTKDFRTTLLKRKITTPVQIFVAGYLNDVSILAKQSKELGLPFHFVGLSTLYDPQFVKLAGSEAESVLFSAPYFSPESDSEVVIDFVSAYRKRYNSMPDVWAGYGYDSVKVAAFAIKESKGKTQNIREGLLSIKDFLAVTGTTTIEADRRIRKPFRMVTVKDGKMIDVTSAR